MSRYKTRLMSGAIVYLLCLGLLFVLSLISQGAFASNSDVDTGKAQIETFESH